MFLQPLLGVPTPRHESPAPAEIPLPAESRDEGQEHPLLLALPPPPPGLTETDREQLRSWGSRPGMGALLTPPAGHIRDDVQRARAYVEQMVERLAGDRLRAEGIHLVVDLYSSDKINAFMQGHAADCSYEASIRRLVHFDKDGKPFYELGINAGTLRQLQHEEELAFVVAHELSHLFEHHSDPTHDLKSPGSTWLSSQSHEAVADHQGIEMMVAAGYDPQGALEGLNRLFARAEPERAPTFLSSLEAGAEAHHHEGVRLSLAQGEIEMLRRTDEKARPTAGLHPLPAFLHLPVAPRDGPHEHHLSGLKQDIAALATRYLVQPRGLSWVAGGIRHIGGDPDDPPELKALRFKYNPNPSELGEAFRAGFVAIRASDASKQDKVDGVLRLFLFLRGFYPAVEAPTLDEQTTAEVTYFLEKNSIGRDGWQAGRALSKMGMDVRRDHPEYAYQHLVLDVMRTPAFEKIAAPLCKVSPQWRTLVDQTPDLLLIAEDTGRPEALGYVADLVKQLAKPEKPGPLDEVHKANVLKFFETRDLTPWIEGVDHWGQFSFQSILAKLFDPETQTAAPEFIEQLRKVLEPRIQAFLEFRERYTLARLQGTDGEDPKLLSGFLQGLFQSGKTFPFAEPFRQHLAPALLAFVRRANHEKSFVYAEFRRGPDPITQADGLGAMLAEMLHAPETTAADRREILEFLARNHETGTSLPKSGARADTVRRIAEVVASLPASDLVSMVVSNDDSQYRDMLSKDIGYALGIPAPAMDDASLQHLADRWDAGEFRIKMQKGLDGQASGRSSGELRDRVARAMEVGESDAFALGQLLNRQTSALTFMGADRDVSRRIASRLSLADLGRLLDGVEAALKHYRLASNVSAGFASKTGLSVDAGAFLLDVLLANQDQTPDLDAWYALAKRILDLNPASVESRPDSRDRLEAWLKPRLENLAPDRLFEWLQKKYVLDGLHAETIADLAGEIVDPGQPVDALAARIAQVDEGLKMRQSHPEAFQMLRDRLAEAAHLQPGDVDRVFPVSQQSVTESAEVLSGPIRGLSALVAMTRERPVAEQIDMIEYLMGRRPDMPDFLLDATSQADVVAPITEIVRDARTQMQHESVAARVLVANSFLAGPNAFVRRPEGMDQMLTYMLRDVKPEHQVLARRLARALLDSQGDTDSLALAYVLGQKSDAPDGKLSEATVLNNLFDAYGVPGIKLKQYLAFTSEFAEFREAFESAQDNAMPLSYYQAVKLVHDRFGGAWPPGLRIERILGSGSVNIGIRYYNPKSAQNEVVVVAREDIETATHYDFVRFKRFLSSLTNTPQDLEKFGYLLGLSDVIHDSVTLEFDKPKAFDMQKSVQHIYHRTVNGWNVRTVDAFSQEHMAIFMEEARGVTARKLQATDPAAYRSAMAAMSQVELDSLLGIDEHGRARPVPLHANPDFHDGQVLIDPATHTVTLLDFGQAVPISNEERDYGLDLLRVIAKAQDVKGSLKILARHVPGVTAAELQGILDRSDRMDIFVHLLSLLNRKGKNRVPIAAVHWVMAMDRQMALGHKIGVPNEQMVRHLVLTSRLGGGFQAYNTLHLLNERAIRVAHRVAAAASGPLASLGVVPDLYRR